MPPSATFPWRVCPRNSSVSTLELDAVEYRCGHSQAAWPALFLRAPFLIERKYHDELYGNGSHGDD
jgi:hypothetical protein